MYGKFVCVLEHPQNCTMKIVIFHNNHHFIVNTKNVRSNISHPPLCICFFKLMMNHALLLFFICCALATGMTGGRITGYYAFFLDFLILPHSRLLGHYWICQQSEHHLEGWPCRCMFVIPSASSISLESRETSPFLRSSQVRCQAGNGQEEILLRFDSWVLRCQNRLVFFTLIPIIILIGQNVHPSVRFETRAIGIYLLSGNHPSSGSCWAVSTAEVATDRYILFLSVHL